MKPRHAYVIITLFALLALSPFSPLYWKLAHSYYEPKKLQAMKFCESLAPLIDAEKKRTGHYPAAIDPEWLKGKRVPQLIRLKHFYTCEHGSYILYFWNPGDFWDDFWAYDSRGPGWANYDANKPKD
jgi:hypothetical protein